MTPAQKPKSVYADVGEAAGVLFATFTILLQQVAELEKRIEKLENHTHPENVRLYK